VTAGEVAVLDPPPFAAPLRAVDRVEVLADGAADGGRTTLRAVKTVRATDPYLGGHFPDLTMLPGVFLIEGVRQAVAAVLGSRNGAYPEVRELRSARFLLPMLGGEEITSEIELTGTDTADEVEAVVRCRRGDGKPVATLALRLGRGAPDAA
jgi:3-hydroxymyristoyl/3-hydroxydecanoyl-(acyl carrier protein) dehydratase